jgi:hypothetical protein
MQFLASTFDSVVARHPPPPGGAQPSSRYNPHDAIQAAAYLCSSGASDGRDLRAALFTYNRSTRPTSPPRHSAAAGLKRHRMFQRRAQHFSRPFSGELKISAQRPRWPQSRLPAGNWASSMCGAETAIPGSTARDRPTPPTKPWASAFRARHKRHNAGPLLPPGTPIAPGDLLFFGTPRRVHHVGISLGGTAMVHAPHSSKNLSKSATTAPTRISLASPGRHPARSSYSFAQE